MNLGSNQELKLRNENFKDNDYLTYISLSSNNLEYLPEKLFKNLKKLEKIDLSNNSLKNLDACTFYPIYSETKRLENKTDGNKVVKAHINATNNNIECNCDIFFMEQVTNVKLNLVCSGEPDYYNGKHIDDLKKEDPSNRECFYKEIDFNCKSQYENSNSLLKKYETFKAIVIVFSCLLFILFFISICLYVRMKKLSTKSIEKADNSFKHTKSSKGFSLVTPINQYKELKQNAE